MYGPSVSFEIWGLLRKVSSIGIFQTEKTFSLNMHVAYPIFYMLLAITHNPGSHNSLKSYFLPPKTILFSYLPSIPLYF